jgi:hypothetical protein
VSGRIRSIKPEIAEDEVAIGLSDAAWRMWVTSWVLADDHGNVRAGEKYLAASVWQDTSRNVEAPLMELIEKGRFEPYSVGGQHYAHIHAFVRHQRIDNAGKPRMPGPQDNDQTWNQELTHRFAANGSHGSNEFKTLPSVSPRFAAREGPPTTDHRPREGGPTADLAATRGGPPTAGPPPAGTLSGLEDFPDEHRKYSQAHPRERGDVVRSWRRFVRKHPDRKLSDWQSWWDDERPSKATCERPARVREARVVHDPHAVRGGQAVPLAQAALAVLDDVKPGVAKPAPRPSTPMVQQLPTDEELEARKQSQLAAAKVWEEAQTSAKEKLR